MPVNAKKVSEFLTETADTVAEKFGVDPADVLDAAEKIAQYERMSPDIAEPRTSRIAAEMLRIPTTNITGATDGDLYFLHQVSLNTLWELGTVCSARRNDLCVSQSSGDGPATMSSKDRMITTSRLDMGGVNELTERPVST